MWWSVGPPGGVSNAFNQSYLTLITSLSQVLRNDQFKHSYIALRINKLNLTQQRTNNPEQNLTISTFRENKKNEATTINFTLEFFFVKCL